MINQGYIAEDAQVKYSFSKSAVLIIAGLLMLSGQAVGAEGYGKQKVVYHINYDDPKTQKSALRIFRITSTQSGLKISSSKWFCMVTVYPYLSILTLWLS